jgi:hypothetical protein
VWERVWEKGYGPTGLGIAVIIAILFVGLLLGLSLAMAHDSNECEKAGGHLITKPAYKSIQEWCISPDGRILG